MKHVNDLQTLRTSHLTEREALVAAAVLPALPENECLVRIHDRDQYEAPDETQAFKTRSPTLTGTRLRRVIRDDFVVIRPKDDRVGLIPSPHAIRTYHGFQSFAISPHDFDAFRIGDDPDFDDTDQTFLTDFGVETSHVDRVERPVPYDVTQSPHDRQPIFPD